MADIARLSTTDSFVPLTSLMSRNAASYHKFPIIIPSLQNLESSAAAFIYTVNLIYDLNCPINLMAMEFIFFLNLRLQSMNSASALTLSAGQQEVPSGLFKDGKEPKIVGSFSVRVLR